MATNLRDLADRLAPSESERLTAEQAAPLLHLSPDSFRRYCLSGVLLGEKERNIWFLRKAEIDRYHRERRSRGKQPERDIEQMTPQQFFKFFDRVVKRTPLDTLIPQFQAWLYSMIANVA